MIFHLAVPVDPIELQKEVRAGTKSMFDIARERLSLFPTHVREARP